MEEKPVPTRAQQIERLAAGEEFDILVVGGGATGHGLKGLAGLGGPRRASQALVLFIWEIENAT